ncbi:hypothetical protein X759_35770 [Mesorhizobium sp. LSHC420B00]|nr:hypothetical protein X759_35770 [Mesorhizobium sp. LSHC420B00]
MIGQRNDRKRDAVRCGRPRGFGSRIKGQLFPALAQVLAFLAMHEFVPCSHKGLETGKVLG